MRREGGRFDGPCVSDGLQFRCNSPDAWNHARVEPRLAFDERGQEGIAHSCGASQRRASSSSSRVRACRTSTSRTGSTSRFPVFWFLPKIKKPQVR